MVLSIAIGKQPLLDVIASDLKAGEITLALDEGPGWKVEILAAGQANDTAFAVL